MANKRTPAFCICGDHVWVPLTRGYVTMVSPEDAGLIYSSTWFALIKNRGVYAGASIGGKMMKLHRAIMVAPENSEVDHQSGNGLDNRRGNLRLASTAQNGKNKRKHRNTGHFKGAYPERGKWKSSICCDGKRFYLGTFATEEKAHAAYVRAAEKLHGEFARAA